MVTLSQVLAKIGYDSNRTERELKDWQEIMEPFIPWEQVRVHYKFGPTVYARIRRLNPDHRGIKNGHFIRGMNYKYNRLRSEAYYMGPKEFISYFGRDEYRKIPKDRIVMLGKRKNIPLSYLMEAGLDIFKVRRS